MRIGLPTSNLTSKWAIVLWGIVSLVPMIPFTLPLFQLSLSDSPRAYLVWIPFLAIAWASWNVTTKPLPEQTASRSRGAGIGLLLCLLVLLGVVFGKTLWPDGFFRFDIGLLLWPVWTLGAFWLIFGLEYSKRAFLPLLYMVLGWPPVYEGIISLLNPVLSDIALSMMRELGRFVNWMTVTPVSFNVATGHTTVAVYVTSACSGSDTILAILVIFPITLALFELTFVKKVLLVVLGSVLAFVFNLIRIVAIVVSLHYLGYRFAIDFLHPILGTVLFIVIIGLLLVYGGKQVSTVSPNFKVPIGSSRLVIPLSLCLCGLMTLWLVPLYFSASGSYLTPANMPGNQISAISSDLNDALRQSGSGSLRVDDVVTAGNTQSIQVAVPGQGNMVQLSLSNLELSERRTPSPSLPSGQALQILHTKLLSHSSRRGIEQSTYLVTYRDASNHSVRYGLDTVVTPVGIYNFQRVYLKAEWITPISGSSSLQPHASEVASSESRSWTFVTSLLHYMNVSAEESNG